MLNSKERAALRATANRLSPIFRLGKSEITPEFTKGVNQALEARELIKIDILQNCDMLPAEAAQILADRTKSDVVMVIGKRFVLYRKKKAEDKKLEKSKADIKKPIKKVAAGQQSKKPGGGRKYEKN